MFSEIKLTLLILATELSSAIEIVIESIDDDDVVAAVDCS
jgi:hypothetical protein